jgi:hypothetical protein
MTIYARDAIYIVAYIRAKENPDCPPHAVKKYQGIMQPYCHRGKGCVACWDKWYGKQTI